MRLAALVTTLLLTAACSRSTWKPCAELEMASSNAADDAQRMRYVNARYRVLDDEPLTIEWEHVRCIEVKSQSGHVEEICGRELQRAQVDHVACR